MRVKTLIKHCNNLGDSFHKEIGEIYDNANPLGDLAAGIVEEYNASDDGAKGNKGAGKGSGKSKSSDSAKPDRKKSS